MKTRAALASASYIADGEDLIAQKKSNLLFNRIINIRFKRARPVNGKDTFTIRSDYEPVYNRDGEGTISFVPCQMKPSISLSYKQVSPGYATEIRVEIDALYIDRMLVGDELDSAGSSGGKPIGNPVESMKIQLGYIDDFKRWDKAVSTPGQDRYTDVDRFYDLEDLDGPGRVLSVQVLSAYRTSMPPESKWLFVGTIAAVDAGLRWTFTDDMLVPGYRYAEFPKKMHAVEAMLYQFITRRFIRPSVDHTWKTRVETDEEGNDVEVRDLYVRDYEFRTATSDRTGKYTKVALSDDGIMTAKDAKALGVRCICSEALKATVPQDMKRTGVHGESAEGVGYAAYSMFNDQQGTLFPQINAIKHEYSYIRFYQLADGNLFFYRKDEEADDIVDDPYVADMQEKAPLKLSAVYDITVGGTRTIRCPFQGVISPMTTILFQSRYRVAEDVAGFFTVPRREMYGFLAVLCDIEFATVEDKNMCTIMCTDIGEDSMPEVDFSGKLKPKRRVTKTLGNFTNDPAGKEEALRKSWVEIEYTVGDYRLGSVDGVSWLDIARGLVECASPDDWDGGAPSIIEALTALKDWNTAGVWTSDRNKNSSYKYHSDNRLVAGLGFKIPWLYKGDKVTIRQPFFKEYDMKYKG